MCVWSISANAHRQRREAGCLCQAYDVCIYTYEGICIDICIDLHRFCIIYVCVHDLSRRMRKGLTGRAPLKVPCSY